MVSLGTQPANRKSGFGHSSPTGARAQDLSRQPARPDLWGARVSNDPGLPDRVQVRRAGGASEGGDIGRGERVAHGRPAERVAVMDEEPDVSQESALVHNSRSRSIIALHPEIRGPA